MYVMCELCVMYYYYTHAVMHQYMHTSVMCVVFVMYYYYTHAVMHRNMRTSVLHCRTIHIYVMFFQSCQEQTLNNTIDLGAIHKCQHFHECTNHTLSETPPPKKSTHQHFLSAKNPHENNNNQAKNVKLYGKNVDFHGPSPKVYVFYTHEDVDILGWFLNIFGQLWNFNTNINQNYMNNNYRLQL